MAYKQLKDADMKVGYVGGWCLKYVQDAYGTDHPYPTAMAAWNAEPLKHTDVPPLGITVPIYLALGNVPAGHVAIRLDDGLVASSTQAGSHPRPYLHSSLNDLIATYGKYNGGATYLGWGEHVGSVRVVAPAQVNATDDQIRRAYLEILERPADDGGLATYRNYPIDFVRKALFESSEYSALVASKQSQAKAKADEEARVAAETKAREEAAARAAAEEQARIEAEARAKEEADAKAKADAESRAKMEAEQKATEEAVAKDIQNKKQNIINKIIDILKEIYKTFFSKNVK